MDFDTHAMFTSHKLLYYAAHWFLSGLAVFLTARLIKGFDVKGFWSALWAAVIIAIANAVIWPALMLLTLPINILSLGLFTFVVNGIVLKICAAFLEGFTIKTWGAAIFGSIVLSIFNMVLHFLFV